MNAAQSSVVPSYIDSVTRMLLGSKSSGPGLMVAAGEPLDREARLYFATLAASTRVDIVYLCLSLKDDRTPVFVDICIFMARDRKAYSWTGCRLALRAGSKRAVLISPHSRHHFRTTSDEIVQVPGKPGWIDVGVANAANRLDKLVREHANALSVIDIEIRVAA